MQAFEGILFILFIGFILCIAAFYKVEKEKKSDLRATVESDRRTQTQYDLRRKNRNANALITLLVGALIALLFLVVFGK